MRKYTPHSLACVALVMAMAACSTPPGQPIVGAASQAPTAPGVAAVQLAGGSVIQGVVLAPAGIIAAGGGNIIATGGGNVVATGGGNLAARSGSLLSGLVQGLTGHFHTQAAGLNQRALAKAEVFLADGAGNPIPRLGHVLTDDKGNYTIPNVPAGFTFVVAAKIKTKDGKDALLRTLAKSTELGTTADVDTGTNLVTASVVSGAGDIGNFNLSTLKAAGLKVDENLSDDTVPDLADNTKLVAKMNELAKSVNEIQSALVELKKDLADIKATLGDLNAKLEAAAKAAASQTPAPQATSAPAATAPPTSTPVETPTPAPQATNANFSTPTPAPRATDAFTTATPTPVANANATPTPDPRTTIGNTASPTPTPTPTPAVRATDNTAATPTPVATTTRAAFESVTLSGHLISNPGGPAVSVDGVHVKLRNNGITAYGSWDADVLTDRAGQWTATVRHETTATDNFIAEINTALGEEGIGNVYIKADGSASYTRYGRDPYPSRLITLP